MKIAFDIQPLVSSEKTGVGYNEHCIISKLISACTEDEFYLEYFDKKNTEFQNHVLNQYLKNNVHVNKCDCAKGSLYRFVSALLPVPYKLFFRSKVQVTHFFNFIIPPGVKGKRVVTIHDMAFKRFAKTVRLKTKTMLRLSLNKTVKRADRIITVSEFSKNEILTFYKYPEKNIVVIPNGVDTRIFNTDISGERIVSVKKHYGLNDKYILYLGMIEPRKNIEKLIQAYYIASYGKDFPQLVIAGGKGWLYESIFKTAKELDIDDKIIFTGYVQDELKPALIAGAHFFCFPSLYEGFGMPVLEAMACGVPVLTSNVSSLPEIAGDAAVLIDPLSVEDIAKGLNDICHDAELRENCVKRGLERVKIYDWQIIAERTYEVYKEVLNE